MAKKYLDYDGLSYFWSQIKNLWALASHTHSTSDIEDFPTSMTPTSHTHGQISNGGAISTNVDIATGDRIIISDSSNGSILKGTSISFDTATEGTDKKALTQAGTWQTFLTSADVPEGASASSTTPKMDGTAAVGIETAFARGDHVHPTDTSRASSTHSHGYLSINGTFGSQSSAITIANGDSLIIGDASVSGKKLAYSNITFDAATDTKALTKKGTWETFSKDGEANVLEGVQMNGTDLTIDANKKVNIPLFKPPTSTVAGEVGLVPAPLYSNGLLPQQYMRGDGVWAKLSINAYTEQTDQKFYIGLSSKNGNSTSLFGETEIPTATTQGSGLMSSSDKSKLDSISMTNGVIDSSVLPSFVDDVIEAYARANQTELGSTWLATGSATGTVITPEAGKIYVLMNSSTNYEQNTQFRWGGTAYVQLNDSGCTAITNAEIDTILAS